jgi:hypothetical protein
MPRPFSYRLDALLSLVRPATATEAIERLHAAIEREIGASSRRMDRAKAKGDEEYLDAIVDEECDHIEELLGIAFVTAQTFITRLRIRIGWASNVFARRIWGGAELRQAAEGL